MGIFMFILGFILGSLAGVFITALLNASKDE